MVSILTPTVKFGWPATLCKTSPSSPANLFCIFIQIDRFVTQRKSIYLQSILTVVLNCIIKLKNTVPLKHNYLINLHTMTIEVDQEIKLTQLELSDAKDIFETIDSQRDYLGKWLPFVAFTRDISDSEQYVNSVVNAPEERFEYVFAIRKGDRFVGLIGFKDTDKTNKKTEIGYWLSEKYQKQGIITRSVDRLCDFAFHQLGINRIQIKCAVGNLSSSNIPKRLGFKLEGIERAGELLTGGFFTDLEIYSRLK